MRSFFLSEYFPFKFRTDVFGVFQRMRLLLEAMSRFGELDLLFLGTLLRRICQLENMVEAEWHLQVNAFVRGQLPGASRPLRVGRPPPPIFFDLGDADHTKAARLTRVCPGPAGRVRAYAAVPILWWSERRAIALARSPFVASARVMGSAFGISPSFGAGHGPERGEAAPTSVPRCRADDALRW
jgi:hypothetical protein